MSIDAKSGPGFGTFVEAAGKFFFRYRNAVFPIIFLATVSVVTPTIAIYRPKVDAYLSAFGFAVAFAGEAFRFLVIGLSYIERGGRGGNVFASSLVTNGLYAHSRNPMYFGNALIALGFVIALGSPVAYLLIPFFGFVYYAIVTVEESYLREHFPSQYADYERNVPRFVPRLDGVRETLAKFTFDWRKALRKEYGTLFATLAGALFLRTFKSGFRLAHSFTLASLLDSSFLVGGGVLFLGFIGTRTLKKTKII